MTTDEDEVLHYRSIMLDDETVPWNEAKIAAAVDVLGEVGLVPEGDVDLARWAAVEGTAHLFSGGAGRYRLRLEASGGWWWDTPSSTLMRNRYSNRPEAVLELTQAVRALTGVAAPYYGGSWFSVQGPPWWLQSNHPFRASDACAIQFFGLRYLEIHNGGRPFPDPPCDSELLADGQLLVAAPSAFGEAILGGVRGITDYLIEHSQT